MTSGLKDCYGPLSSVVRGRSFTFHAPPPEVKASHILLPPALKFPDPLPDAAALQSRAPPEYHLLPAAEPTAIPCPAAPGAPTHRPGGAPAPASGRVSLTPVLLPPSRAQLLATLADYVPAGPAARGPPTPARTPPPKYAKPPTPARAAPAGAERPWEQLLTPWPLRKPVPLMTQITAATMTLPDRERPFVDPEQQRRLQAVGAQAKQELRRTRIRILFFEVCGPFSAGTSAFPLRVVTGRAPGRGWIRRERTSEAVPEAVRQALGGGFQSGWGWLPSVTNAIEAGSCCQGDGGWA